MIEASRVPRDAQDFRASKKPDLTVIQGGERDRVSPPPIPQEKTSPRPGSAEWAQMRHNQRQREHEATMAEKKAEWAKKSAADKLRIQEEAEAPLLGPDEFTLVPPVPGSKDWGTWSVEQKNKAFREKRDREMEEFLAPVLSSDLLQEDASGQSPPPIPLEAFAPRRRSEIPGPDSGDSDDTDITGAEKAEIEQVNRELAEAFAFNPSPKGQERRVPDNETEEERINRELGEVFGFVPDTEAHESEDHHIELSENIQAIDQLLQRVVLNQEQRSAANQALGEIIIKKGTGDAGDLAEAYALADVLMNRLEKVSLLQSHVKGDRENMQKARTRRDQRRLREFRTSTSGINEIPSKPTYISQSSRPRARINGGGTSGMWGQRTSVPTAGRSYARKSAGERPLINPYDAGRSRWSRGSRIDQGVASRGGLDNFVRAPGAITRGRRSFNRDEFNINAEAARQNEIENVLTTKGFEKAVPAGMSADQARVLAGAILDAHVTVEQYLQARKDANKFGIFKKGREAKRKAIELLAEVARNYDAAYADMPNQENINTQSFRIG